VERSKHGAQRWIACAFVALTAGALWAGCGGVSPQSACEEACDCVSCPESALNDCVEQLEESRERAAAAGCEAEWDDALDCQMSGFVCEEGRPDSTAGCETEEAAVRRCAGTVCDEAAEICGASGDETVQCTGQAECASRCIVDLDSCDTSNGALVDCLTECAG
jgi:hypothetical protein